LSKSIELNVLDIYLDKQNPRHEPIDDQDEIIKQLIKTEQIKKLASDIAKNGLSPIELFAVIKDKSDNHIVVEGNRRLCALTLLNDPLLSPDSHIKYFTDLSKKHTNFPSKVKCQSFANREDADIWIERRHEGQQDGIGTKQWEADQKTRHNVRREKPDKNALAQSLLDYSTENGFLSVDKKNKILTTATRYLGNPTFREAIGIVSNRTEPVVYINVTYDEFDVVLQRFCTDLNENIITSRSKKEDWENYARQLIQEGVAPIARTKTVKLADRPAKTNPAGNTLSNGAASDDTASNNNPTSNEDNEESSGNNQGAGNASGSGSNNKNKKHPGARKYIIDSDFRPTINNRILRRVFQELKTIEVDNQTLAVSLLCRAFLENLYSEFYEKVGGSHLTDKTHVVMNKVINLIELDKQNLTKAEKSALGALKRVQSNENNVLSPRTLGANAHAGHYPIPSELKTEWDNIAAILIYMLKRT